MPEAQPPHPNPLLPQMGKFWTVSNVLSLSRLVIAVPICYLIITRPPPDLLTIILVFVAIWTDWLDGKIARWSKTVSDWGKILDPTADKIGGGAILIAMGVAGLLPVWLLVLFVVRELIIVGLWQYMVRRTGHVYMSLMPGKLTVSALALTVFLFMLGLDSAWHPYFIWLCAGLMIYSLAYYFFLFFRELRGISKPGSVNTVAAQQGATLPTDPG